MIERSIALAVQCMNQGRHAEAIEHLKQALSLAPDNAEAHALLGACLTAQKRLHAAEHELGIALQLAPRSAYTFLALAELHFLTKHFGKARHFIDESLAINPEFVPALLFKASLARFEGKQDLSWNAIRTAATIAPESTEVLLSIAKHQQQFGKLPDAISACAKALGTDAQNLGANILMGELQLAAGNVDDALYHARFSVSLNPNDSEALKLMANIKARSNFFTGLWWRFNSFAGKFGNSGAIAILIGAFIVFNFTSLLLADFGFQTASSVTSYAWLLLAAYSWICLPIYQRLIQKELDEFQFNRNF